MTAHEQLVALSHVGQRIRITRPGSPAVDVVVDRVGFAPDGRVVLTTRAVEPAPLTRQELDDAVGLAQPIGYVDLAVDALVALLAARGIHVVP